MKKILFVLAILITSVVNVNAQLSKDVKVIKISNGVHDYLTTVVNAIPITQESKIKASSSVIIDYNKFKTNTDIETLLHHLDTLLPSLDDIEKRSSWLPNKNGNYIIKYGIPTDKINIHIDIEPTEYGTVIQVTIFAWK